VPVASKPQVTGWPSRQKRNKAIVFGAGVEHGELSPATLAWDLEEDLIAGLGDVERYKNAGRGV
jgi:hypothetical protein